MTYLFIAYAVFWGMTFALVLSILARQKAAERELSVLKVMLNRHTTGMVDDEERTADETRR